LKDNDHNYEDINAYVLVIDLFGNIICANPIYLPEFEE
jgi:hypothetical protein